LRGSWLVRDAPGARTLLLTALVAQVCVSVSDQGVPMLAGFVKQDLAVSAAAAGLLVSSMLLGKAAGSYFVGTLVDAVGERRMLAVSAVASGALLILASALPLGFTVVVLVAAGFFTAATTPAGGRMILLAFPRSQRGTGMGVRQTGVPIGGVVAALVLPPFVALGDWRLGLVAAGAVTLVGGLVSLALAGVEERRPAGDRTRASARHWLSLARDRNLMLATVWGCLVITGQYAVVAFLPLDVHETSSISLGTTVGLVAVASAGGMVGRVAWGGLSDRTFGSRRRPLLAVITVCGVACALLLAALPAGAPIAATAAVAFAAGFSILGWQGVWVTLICEIGGVTRAGVATGFAQGFIALASFMATPLLGLVVDLTGSYQVMWLALSAVLGLSLVPLLLVEETVGELVVSS
jgi:MFS transporter, ACS family, aldohexuronate transporter